MKFLQTAAIVAAAAALAACAATPEQQAARAEAQKRREQNLQVALAAQCDRETADLMRRQFDRSNHGTPTAADKAFRLKYIDKVNDPMFQACYKMAWQNYISQAELREARYRYYYDDWGYPFRYPFWW